ncbi:MAG TPA: urate hydroxylase PuuD [Thermoanaerobaculia bacterium]|nr:urate hydroxylase PuuD [Thermoanaerobaculia bacterium]
MPQNVNDILQLFLRWAHVVAGIIWIGHLYFFNWVNAHFAKALDGPTKKVVVPELMPRALYWFRWGAAWTWITGILLGGLIYYHSRIVFEDPTDTSNNPWLWLAIVFVILAVGFVVYNAVMKSVKNILVANTIVLLLLAGVYLFLEHVGKFGGRSLYIHTGVILGTMMAANVWMVIWPYQKKIIAATKDGTAPDAALVAQAGLRSRHNTFMSVPLVFTMVSNHYPTMYGNTYRDLCLLGVFVLGFVAVRLLYGKSAKVAPF